MFLIISGKGISDIPVKKLPQQETQALVSFFLGNLSDPNPFETHKAVLPKTLQFESEAILDTQNSSKTTLSPGLRGWSEIPWLELLRHAPPCY